MTYSSSTDNIVPASLSGRVKYMLDEKVVDNGGHKYQQYQQQ